MDRLMNPFVYYIKKALELIFNNKLVLTCGHKTFGVKWLFGHPATHQLSATVDTNAARSPKRFIPQNRWRSFLGHTANGELITDKL